MHGIPEKVSEDVRKLNPQLFGSPAFTPAMAQEATEYQRESELQAACEKWLTGIGFRSMTAAHCSENYAPRGWYGHLAQPKGNPFLPDLFIFNESMTRCLLVELKVVEDYRPGQLPMIRAGRWKLARSVFEFTTIVKQWESSYVVVS